MGGVLVEIKNGRSEVVKVNGGSHVDPVPNWATKAETDADVMAPPSGQTSTILSARPVGLVSLPVDGGVTPPPDGGGDDDVVEDSAGTVMGAGLLLQVTV